MIINVVVILINSLLDIILSTSTGISTSMLVLSMQYHFLTHQRQLTDSKCQMELIIIIICDCSLKHLMALNFPKFAKVIYIHRNLSSNDPMTWIFNFVLPLKTDYSKWSNLIYTWCPLFGNGHEMLWILQFFLPLNSMKQYSYGDT